MVDSVSQLRDAALAYGDRFGDTRLLPLAVALTLHLISLLVRSGVWCGILRSAFPNRRVGFWATAWAYLVGVGADAVAPFRGGDIVRIYATRRELGNVSVTTIVSTMVAESVFGAVVVVGMLAAIVGLGWIPPVVSLHDAGAFEFSFYADHAYAVLAVALLLGVAVVLLVRTAGSRVQLFWLHIAQGVRILKTPARFARVVVAPQIVDWILRVGVAYWMLAAFGIPAALRYALLVVVIDSVSTALPFTPGGVGAQQGLLVFALGGVATSGQILASSLGAQAVIVAFNVLFGLIAAGALFGHMRMGVIRREAHAWRDLDRRGSP